MSAYVNYRNRCIRYMNSDASVIIRGNEIKINTYAGVLRIIIDGSIRTVEEKGYWMIDRPIVREVLKA